LHLFAQIFPSLDAAAVFHDLCLKVTNICRRHVSWCPTVVTVTRTADSSVRRTGFVNHKLTRMVDHNNDERDAILRVLAPWYRQYGLPDHLAARLLSDSLAYIFTVS